MAGRVRRGESWRFAELRSVTSVFVAAELAYLDRFELQGSDESPTRRWAMDQNGYMATAIAYAPSIDEESLESVRSDIVSPDDCCADDSFACGLDVPFERLMIGRFLANNGASFRKARDSYQSAVLKHLTSEPSGKCAP